MPTVTEHQLWEGAVPFRAGDRVADRPWLSAHPVAGPGPSAAMLVLPGGGYGYQAEHEGDPVAGWLNTLGVAAFVLHYRVAPYRHPVPLVDAVRAIRYLRHHAGRFGVDPGRVPAPGFGGEPARAATRAPGPARPVPGEPGRSGLPTHIPVAHGARCRRRRRALPASRHRPAPAGRTVRAARLPRWPARARPGRGASGRRLDRCLRGLPRQPLGLTRAVTASGRPAPS